SPACFMNDHAAVTDLLIFVACEAYLARLAGVTRKARRGEEVVETSLASLASTRYEIRTTLHEIQH
ncbi:MAG TPA: hypothetical protein VF078_03920, partial [Nitrospira sp.]